MGSENKRPPSTRNASPVSKRQRVDRSAPPSTAPSPRPINSPSTSRNSTPAAETRRNGRSRHAGTDTPAPDEDQPPPEDDQDEGAVAEDDTPPEPDALAEHHTISAKTLPDHQPRPGETKTDRNGGGGGRATVGGKGQKGEEALEHAVAAREQVERRRVEYREENIKTGQVPKGQLEGAGEVVAAEDDVVKVEEREGGATQEEEGTQPVRRERPAITEERDRIIQFRVVTNDGDPASLVILTGLKNIFQKQLPKMPREYIARLVFDRNHYSMAIVKRGLEVVGGITYRPFEARQFAEIVFCAITGTEQVKGYGSHLMNHLKDYVKKATSCMHFLTYADNYAIGYFKKQGFTKEITLDRSVWAAYIKDYEGGTIMHCAMLPRIEYLQVSQILSKQKEVVLREIQQRSRSHIVHPGLDLFLDKAKEESLDPSDIPGLKESGWTPEMDRLTRRPKRHPQFAIMQKLHTLLNDHPSSWAFANPVNAEEVTDYYDRIKEPMDFSTMAAKLEGNAYKGTDEFVRDARLIFDNCRAYNAVESNYVKNANKLEAFLNEQVKLYLE